MDGSEKAYCLWGYTPSTTTTGATTPTKKQDTIEAVPVLPHGATTWDIAKAKFANAWAKTKVNRYDHANFVYLIYTFGIIYINYGIPNDRDAQNGVYMLCNIIHIFNACQYAYAWKGRAWSDPVVYPEYLNVLGAFLYLISGSLYPKQQPPLYLDQYTRAVHRIELLACIVELIASVGWLLSWHATYVRMPGRGFTLDDPDVWALGTIFCGAIAYITYNLQNINNPSGYATNKLYMRGDAFYGANSVLYLIAGLRDDGWWWWMPLAGGPYSYQQLVVDKLGSGSSGGGSKGFREPVEEEEGVRSIVVAQVDIPPLEMVKPTRPQFE